ncbi:MAG: ABC transporter substrate-binding protein, partial [Candidatus Neomicrothrix subdominans]
MSPRGRPLCTAILALVTLGLSLSACGGDEGGASTLNWYVFDEPGGSFTNAAKNCSTEGYDIKVQVLPADADQQREQLVRRLAAGDTSIDLIGMDVIWTAEFAGAEWILPLEGKAAEAATKGKLEAAVE